jgi:hypothetical protein
MSQALNRHLTGARLSALPPLFAPTVIPLLPFRVVAEAFTVMAIMPIPP